MKLTTNKGVEWSQLNTIESNAQIIEVFEDLSNDIIKEHNQCEYKENLILYDLNEVKSAFITI